MSQENYPRPKASATLSIAVDDLIKLGILIIVVAILFASYFIGYDSGRQSVMINASKAVCVRQENPAPKNWCDDVILKEIYTVKP